MWVCVWVWTIVILALSFRWVDDWQAYQLFQGSQRSIQLQTIRYLASFRALLVASSTGKCVYASILPSPLIMLPPPPPPPHTHTQFVQGNMALYVKYSVGLEDQYPYVIAVLLVSAIAWMPFWQWVILKFGKKTAFSVGMWVFMPCLVSLLFVPFYKYLIYPMGFLGGMGVSCAYLLPWWVNRLCPRHVAVMWLSLHTGPCYRMWSMMPF